jgi:hypothetical protein
MAQNRTANFDILVQISEPEINAQVAAAFAAGMTFPSSLSSPVSAFGITGILDINFSTPVIDLDRPRPRIGVTIPFQNSQLQITAPAAVTLAPLGGTLLIVDVVQMRTASGTQQAVIDFTAGAPTVTVVFDAATAALLTPILTGFGVSLTVAQNQLAEIVRDRLVNDIQRIALTPPIPVGDDSDPLTPSSIEVTTVNDTSAADRDALVFGLRTDPASGGNINAITQSFIPNGAPAVIMLSNFWLLAHVVRPRLATALGANLSDFDTPLRLNNPIPAPGGQGGTLRRLEAHVEGNRIRVEGRATASGTGWSAVSNFGFFIDLSLAGGEIVITSSTPEIDTDVSLEWWVWLLSLGLGGLFGGIVGAIVGAIVPAIVESVAEGMADQMLSDAITTEVGAIPPIPLGPIGGGLEMSALELDDLELHGTILRSLNMPVKNTGGTSSTGAFTLDLDAGTLHSANSQLAKLDLKWDPNTGLHTLNQARLAISGTSYGSITPVQLRNMNLNGTHVAAGQIPVSINLPFISLHHEIVLGVKTSQGRLAKVRAWRNLTDISRLHLSWTTYDTPIPALDIALRWSVLQRGESFTYINGNFATCTRYEVSRRCTIEAWPKLVVFPVNYQWCLCGQVLTEGSGKVAHAGGSIAYTLTGRELVLETGMAESVDCELCVSAIDSRGRELFTCVPLQSDPTDTNCGKPRRFIEKPKFEIIPCDPLIAIAGFEPTHSPLVSKQLSRAMGKSG